MFEVICKSLIKLANFNLTNQKCVVLSPNQVQNQIANFLFPRFQQLQDFRSLIGSLRIWMCCDWLDGITLVLLCDFHWITAVLHFSPLLCNHNWKCMWKSDCLLVTDDYNMHLDIYQTTSYIFNVLDLLSYNSSKSGVP